MKKLLTLIFAAMMAISMSAAVVSYAMPTDDKATTSDASKDKKKSSKKKKSEPAPAPADKK